MVDSTHSALVQLRKYELCRYCLSRQGQVGRRSVEKCHICRGLFDRLETAVEKALASMGSYEFDTLLVGATLATQFFEREDALRAKLKIRGKENIKSQLTRELGQRLSKVTGKRVDFARPDLAVNVVIDKDGNIDAAAHARPLTLQGRYTKKVRGLPQKQERCPMCQGKGCNMCDNTGFYGDNSVEGILAKHIAKITGGRSPRFSWVGSEDQNSLVLGKGRPFYVKVSDPRVRTLKKRRLSEAGVAATMVRVLDDVPDVQARFTVRTKITCTCARPITRDDISKLMSLADAEIKFASRSKVVLKKIHSVLAKKTGDREFVLSIRADGGLPIKQLVGGQEYIEPNISAMLGAKCECVIFDILSVDPQ